MLQQRQFSDYIQPQGRDCYLGGVMALDESCTCVLGRSRSSWGCLSRAARDKCKQGSLQTGGRNPDTTDINKETWKFRCIGHASSMPTEHPKPPNTSCMGWWLTRKSLVVWDWLHCSSVVLSSTQIHEAASVQPLSMWKKDNKMWIEREIKETIPFTIATKRIKYLGVYLPKEWKTYM